MLHFLFTVIIHVLALNKLHFQLNATCGPPNIVQHVLSETINFS